MASKRQMLEVIPRATLQKLASQCDLTAADRRSRDAMVDALVRARGIKIEELLAAVPLAELKAICRQLGLPAAPKTKSQIIAHIAAAKPSSSGARAMKKKVARDKVTKNGSAGSLRRHGRIKTKKSEATGSVYVFTITLSGTTPPVWRRIRVGDCTLDKLHEHIQTSMGWTNSHLHHFQLGEQFYGDPQLMMENMEDLNYEDSTKTLLSEIIPKDAEVFRFVYEYDFGDSWDHEIVCEKRLSGGDAHEHPICLDGGRACPPEDCGGVWGYAEFLAAISNTAHSEHERMLEWIGGEFDPERFSAATATNRMKRGLPDWRSMP
jgi:hypothetical protein